MTTEFDAARSEILDATKIYADCIGFLTANMVGRTLNHAEMQQRTSLLNWLWKGDHWERHQYYREKRVQGTGAWLLNSDWYKKWCYDEAVPILICLGMRISFEI